MATNTPLQSILLTSSTSTVTFSNINQTYTDLVLVASTRSLYNGTNDALFITINGDSSALYSRTEMYNSVGGRVSGDTAFKYHGKTAGATSNAGTFGTSTINFMNYSNSTTFKTLIARCGMADSTYSEIKMSVGLYRSTNAITNMSITSESGTSFVAGSTFDLYGIQSGAPKASGGNTLSTDGNYWYHTFTSSGTFSLQRPTSVDYLVVAGGGGGGSRSGGGGGAGGLRSTVTATGGGGSVESALSMAPGLYTVTIGAGGAAGSRAVDATVGSNSVFSSITSTGGGRGQSALGTGNGGAGGSGGGAANNSTGGTATSGQGFAGGNSNATSFDAGGGGGAGAVGANASTVSLGSGAGNGGAGVTTSISGSSVTYGGGGGGGSFNSVNQGTGGTGGGGNGADTAPTAGTANTGGGGGGAGNSANTNTTPAGAAGGSGIVIVRYAV